MKNMNMIKFAAALVLVTSVAGFAQEKAKAPMTASQALANAKAMDAKDRQVMVGHCDAMDKQIAALEQSVKAGATPAEQAKQIAALKQTVQELKGTLAKTPQYFDPPKGGGNPTQ